MDFLKEAKSIRVSLDDAGAKDKIGLIVADGSYCDRTCMNMDIPGLEIIARCRKDAKLCFEENEDLRRFYSKEKFTPEQVRQSE